MNLILFIGLSLICLFLLYLCLIAPRILNKPDRSPFLGAHYAHRGLFDNESDAPENSLPAFQKAVDAGYGIEMDVQLTKDNVPVVFHDATLLRMCGKEGNVWEYTLEELKQFTLGKSTAAIPTFEEVLHVVNGKVPLIIEYKLDRVQTTVCELGNALLEQYNGTYCIESFHPLALLWYRKHRKDILRGQLSMNFSKEEKYRGKFIYWIMTNLLTNFVTKPDFIAYCHSDKGNLSRRLTRLLGALSVTWTIKSNQEYEVAKNAFDLFIFDSCRL